MNWKGFIPDTVILATTHCSYLYWCFITRLVLMFATAWQRSALAATFPVHWHAALDSGVASAEARKAFSLFPGREEENDQG